MNRTHPYFTRALLGACLLLCLLPNGAKAQLFGGMIKTSLGTITLTPSQNYFVSSIYDTDYLPYTAPSGVATTGTQAANGLTNDPGETAVNVQGTITTTGVTVRISCTATGIGTLPAYSYQINIPAASTEDGISRDLKLSWLSQTYTQHSKTIYATLQAVGGTINIKKLDINAGIGNDYLGVLLGQLQYPTYDSGATSLLSVRNMPGIPDKMFGLADNGGVVRHNFLYLPITGEDGRVWLNNNLGADYANVSKASFNPMQQSQNQSDYHGNGSLFQYGRKPDGHELINWTGTATGTAVTGTTATKSDAPAHDLFITAPEIDKTWATTVSKTRWAPASENMPCPSGYRIPSNEEYTAYSFAVGMKMPNWSRFHSCQLRYSSPGYRAPDGTLMPPDYRQGLYRTYPAMYAEDTWPSEANYFGWTAYLEDAGGCVYFLYGGSVRCIKN